MPKTTLDHDGSTWAPKKFPGVENQEALKASFMILNDWAEHLKDWEVRVRAMCSILEVKENLRPEQFTSVLAAVQAGEHSKAAIRQALDNAGSGSDTGVAGASDVVGHPPDPPFA